MRNQIPIGMIHWSDEDKCYIGTCPGILFGGIHGNNPIKLRRELLQIIRSELAYRRKTATASRTRRSA